MTFLDTANDALIAESKRAAGEILICAVNLDLHQPHEGLTVAPASLSLTASFTVHDLLSSERLEWRIGHNFVSFTPGVRQPHLLRVER